MVRLDNIPKSLWVFSIIGLVFFFAFATLIQDKKWCEEQNAQVYQSSYSGLVDRVFIDSTEHMYPTIQLNTGKKIYTPHNLTLYEYAKFSDSIIKHKESYTIEVYRKNDMTEFNQYVLCD